MIMDLIFYPVALWASTFSLSFRGMRWQALCSSGHLTRTRSIAFYARRLKRLSPTLVVVVVFVTGLLIATLVDPHMPALPSYYVSGMLALVGMSDNYFATVKKAECQGGADNVNTYFGTSILSPVQAEAHNLHYNPFLHSWSLG